MTGRTPLRIGVVTTSYPRFAGDAAGCFVDDHVQALRALGHRVEVIAAGDGVTPSDHEVQRIASPLFYAGGAPDRLEQALGAALGDVAAFTARLAAAVAWRARRWDRIVAHWLVPAALVAAAVSQKPLVAIAHGGDVHTLRRLGLLAPTLRLLRARRARVVFVSAALRELARAAVPGFDGDVQPMGIDVARFAAIERRPASVPTVLVAARLVPIKGVDVAIDALARLPAPTRLVIAGDGPLREALWQHVRERGVADRVELLGQVNTATRDRLLGSASVVVVPSRVVAGGRSEGAPLVAIEALAAGVPVVASKVGGLAELPAAGVAHVPPDDAVALAAAIERVLAAPPAADSLRVHVRHLDWREVAPRLVRSDRFVSW